MTAPDGFPATPQHDRMTGMMDRQREVQEFLDWMVEDQQIVLCRFQAEHWQHIDGRKGMTHPQTWNAIFPTDASVAIDVTDAGTYERAAKDDYWWVAEGYYPIVSGDAGKGRLIGQFLGIDADALEREKVAMLDWLRQRNAVSS